MHKIHEKNEWMGNFVGPCSQKWKQRLHSELSAWKLMWIFSFLPLSHWQKENNFITQMLITKVVPLLSRWWFLPCVSGVGLVFSWIIPVFLIPGVTQPLKNRHIFRIRLPKTRGKKKTGTNFQMETYTIFIKDFHTEA